jgi:hypothetical protein
VKNGYHATGETEFYGVWTTQGKMFELTRDAVAAADLPHQALLRPPLQFGVGGAFQTTGVPQIAFLAGPTYLLTISPSGEMGKLDADLAARQVAWIADLVRRIDPIPAAELRQGDPTLGSQKPGARVSHPEACGPAAPAMHVNVEGVTRGALRRGRPLRGKVTVTRPGYVRLRAVLERGRARTSLADVVMRMTQPGTRRFRLRTPRRGRTALRAPGRFRVLLTGRYRPPTGPTIVRRVIRRVRG